MDSPHHPFPPLCLPPRPPQRHGHAGRGSSCFLTPAARPLATNTTPPPPPYLEIFFLFDSESILIDPSMSFGFWLSLPQCQYFVNIFFFYILLGKRLFLPTLPPNAGGVDGGKFGREKTGKEAFQRAAEIHHNIIKFFGGNARPSVNVMKWDSDTHIYTLVGALFIQVLSFPFYSLYKSNIFATLLLMEKLLGVQFFQNCLWKRLVDEKTQHM